MSRDEQSHRQQNNRNWSRCNDEQWVTHVTTIIGQWFLNRLVHWYNWLFNQIGQDNTNTVSSGGPWQCWIEVQAAVARHDSNLADKSRVLADLVKRLHVSFICLQYVFRCSFMFSNKSKLKVVFSDSECQPQVPTCLTLLLESVDHCRCFSRIYFET